MTTQQTKAVDWSQPIEAVHGDGRVVAVALVETHSDDPYTPRKVFPRLTKPDAWWFQEDGLWDDTRPNEWRIRNVAQPEVPCNSKAPTPSPELTARMVALEAIVTALAAQLPLNYQRFSDLHDRAVALLEPADGDLIEAREIYIQHNDLGGDEAVYVRSGEMDKSAEMPAILAAIKRGRALAEAERLTRNP